MPHIILVTYSAEKCEMNIMIFLHYVIHLFTFLRALLFDAGL